MKQRRTTQAKQKTSLSRQVAALEEPAQQARRLSDSEIIVAAFANSKAIPPREITKDFDPSAALRFGLAEGARPIHWSPVLLDLDLS